MVKMSFRLIYLILPLPVLGTEVRAWLGRSSALSTTGLYFHLQISSFLALKQMFVKMPCLPWAFKVPASRSWDYSLCHQTELSWFFDFSVFVLPHFVVLWIELKILKKPGKCSTTDLDLQTTQLVFNGCCLRGKLNYKGTQILAFSSSSMLMSIFIKWYLFIILWVNRSLKLTPNSKK